MLIILISILTTSVARTTHSFINIKSNDRHSYILPVFDLSVEFKNGNGDHVVIFPESNVHRRIDSEYQYPYENSNGQWNKQTVIETAQLSDRFEDDTTQKPGAVVKIVKVQNGQYNKPQNDSKNISALLENLNVKQQNSASNEPKSDKTTSKPNSTNLNTPRKLYMYPTNIYQNSSSVNQSSINPYHNSVKNVKNKNTDNNTKTNTFTTESCNRTMGPSINLDIGGTLRAKSARDNEVKGVGDGDKWIWSNSETTTLVPLDDRAAFAGNNCPDGMVRIRDQCVAVD